MNSIRDYYQVRHLVDDGSHEGARQFFGLQWATANQWHDQHSPEDNSLIPHPQNARIFLTPYAYEYFKDTFPPELPANCKTKYVAVITDVDLFTWHMNFSGAPYHAFDQIIDAAIDKKSKDSVIKSAALWSFFEQKTTQEVRHRPSAFFKHDDASVSLMVLSASNTAEFHLREISGVGCYILPEGISDGEVHDGMMLHEHFHLASDDHLTDIASEIGADKAELEGTTNPLLKDAQIHARIVGGFMWPFHGRQTGLALIDPRFEMGTFQEAQMTCVLEWCDEVFNTFYNPKALSNIVRGVYEEEQRYAPFLPEPAHRFFKQFILARTRSEMEEMNLDEFKKLFDELEGEPHIKQFSWEFITQTFMMHLQVSNSKNIEFYGAMNQLSKQISEGYPDNQKIRKLVHDKFRESLEALVPNLPDIKPEEYKPVFYSIQLPGSKAPQNPFTCERR
ncbi:MAG: hypothetical protein AAF549_03170 [Pseudomonadota bacterium]